MKIHLLLSALLLLLSHVTLATEQKLTDKLAVFEPYLGTWQSVFKMQNGKPVATDVSHWERALNGDSFIAYEEVTGESTVNKGITKVRSTSKLQ